MPPAISLRGICRSFGSIDALRGIDLDIEEGLITAVVGDNGSGKSTLIKIISGDIAPDSGTISAAGTERSAHTPRMAIGLGIGTVYQDLALDDTKSGYENIFLGRELLRFGIFLDRSAMMREAREIIDRLGMNVPDLTLPVRSLSGGQRQGLALARAIRSGCRVLLLDEPTSAMGVRETARVIELMRRLRDGGMTQVIVSHNLFQVFEIADIIAVIRGGRLIARIAAADSSPEEMNALISSDDAA